MDKRASLAEAVARHVRDGDCVFLGGFGQCVPFALGHEVIRQRRRGLAICRTGADILADQMIAAGAVARVIVGWLGNPGIGLGHAFRRAAEAGGIAIEETSNFGLLLRLHAAALGVPFLPTRSLRQGDVPGADPDRHRTVACPYTAEALTALPALVPDVALIHAHRADAAGNVQMDGLVGDTIEGATASRTVIASVERIVTEAEIRAGPQTTILPSFRVAAVVHAPGGAWPSYVHGQYGRDDAAYAAYDTVARDPARLEAWLRTEVMDGPRGPALPRWSASP
jgi:glutaconate CoA-transferase subunit A